MWCLLLCKDRNFKANHNSYTIGLPSANDVCYSAKIGILKQITTRRALALYIMRCLLLCKDRNFKANHNGVRSTYLLLSDVCYSAKIGILKQITTEMREGIIATADVCYSAKIGILKQITTLIKKLDLLFRCLLLCKDRNFKANHNRPHAVYPPSARCLLLCKDRNFKANHNDMAYPLIV